MGQAFIAQTAAIATGTSKITLVQVVAAANHGVKVTSFGVFFQSTDLDATPILVEVARQTTAGTMSSLTPVKGNDSNGDTLDTTAQHTATAEPTEGDVLWRGYVHPTSGYERIFPLGQEWRVGAGDRIGIAVTAAASVNAVARIEGEE